MPKHDLPDGREKDDNLIDFREHLLRRAKLSGQDNDDRINEDRTPAPSSWDAFRHAEYSDGKRLRFGRYDAMWIALVIMIGWLFWYLVLR